MNASLPTCSRFDNGRSPDETVVVRLWPQPGIEKGLEKKMISQLAGCSLMEEQMLKQALRQESLQLVGWLRAEKEN